MKKLLFIRNILVMDDAEIIKRIFLERLNIFQNDPALANTYSARSPIFNIIKVAQYFGVMDIFEQYGNDGTIPSKQQWSKRIWSVAWELESQLERANAIIDKGNGMLRQVIGPSKYISWWKLSDARPNLIRMSETMVKILCQSSQLKSDDFNLKGKPMTSVMCSNCDLGIVENIDHIFMQCPFNVREKEMMINRILCIKDGSGMHALNSGSDVIHVLLGGHIEGLSEEQMFNVWQISGEFIVKIYRKILSSRTGIG